MTAVWKRRLVIAAIALAAWWFFMGDNPAQILRTFVGRGKRLTSSSLDSEGNVVESIEDLQAQAAAAIGRPVSEDALLLARVSASEHAGAFEREKAAIQWVCKNDADSHGWSIRYTVTVNPGTLGVQAGRRYSTRGGGVLGEREVHEDDLAIAEGILSGATPDLTGGATKFVHKTGFKTVAAYFALVDKWEQEGMTPIFLGDVSSLVVFVAGVPAREGDA